MSLLAIGWEPELRGLLTVIMGVVVLMGSVYMIMATNMGSRLSFLVTLTGLMGWMVLMGLTWWIYGIGWAGSLPTWEVQDVFIDAPVGKGFLARFIFCFVAHAGPHIGGDQIGAFTGLHGIFEKLGTCCASNANH